jgi:hypothetical protein
VTRRELRILVLFLIGLGLILVGLYSIRTLHAYREVRGHRPPPDLLLEPPPRETDVELIRDWMTIPYIARMYDVPPGILYEALEIPPHGNEDENLRQLNEKYFPKERGLVETRVKASILEYQVQQVSGDNASVTPTSQATKPILP